MNVTFWGVRGSIASPGPDTAHFGGNTACLEVRFPEKDRYVIVDAGSGIRPLGDALVAREMPARAIDTDIFLTHTHWDHILGFPFFKPIYIPGTKLRVYGPVTYEEDTLDKVIGDLLRYRYFPVMHSDLAARIDYRRLGECSLDLGDGISVSTVFLNHTISCLGYRFTFGGKSICTAFDTEPFTNLFAADPDDADYDEEMVEEGRLAAEDANARVAGFFRGADILIHDAQYTTEEYVTSKTGWGHSSFEDAVQNGVKAGVKTLVLFHHDPVRTDRELEEIVQGLRGAIPGAEAVDILVAREGDTLEV